MVFEISCRRTGEILIVWKKYSSDPMDDGGFLAADAPLDERMFVWYNTETNVLLLEEL
jgi:hypothetical protein